MRRWSSNREGRGRGEEEEVGERLEEGQSEMPMAAVCQDNELS